MRYHVRITNNNYLVPIFMKCLLSLQNIFLKYEIKIIPYNEIEKIMVKFINHPENQNHFPLNIRYEISKRFDNKEKTFHIFEDLYRYCFSYLEMIYCKNFVNTKSFSYLKRKFVGHEKINSKLYNLKFLSVCSNNT